MSNIVCAPILREEEGRDLCGTRVVAGGSPELEEVENRQSGYKERKAPQGRAGEKKEASCGDQRR